LLQRRKTSRVAQPTHRVSNPNLLEFHMQRRVKLVKERSNFNKEQSRDAKGRVEGEANKVTPILTDAILMAANAVGLDGKGKNGLVGYLNRIAMTQPRAMRGFLETLVGLQAHDKREYAEHLQYKTEAYWTARCQKHGLSIQEVKELLGLEKWVWDPKGHAKGKVNKATPMLKNTIPMAAENVKPAGAGNDGSVGKAPPMLKKTVPIAAENVRPTSAGNDGLVGYLTRVALNDPVAMCGLLRKTLQPLVKPKTAKREVYETKRQLQARLRESGIPIEEDSDLLG
jgi:hypothetical protein